VKGILLAGGSGTRLRPLTQAISKHLLPVYSKPMIYYPLSTLMLAGVREVLLVTTPRDVGGYQALLGDGSHLGITISYAIQPLPNGLAGGLLLAEEYASGDQVALILGDNIFHGAGVGDALKTFAEHGGATIFSKQVRDASRYGVVEVDQNNKAISIEEKPTKPKSTLAITGLYFFDNSVFDRAKKVTPSRRGELEITDVQTSYLESGDLQVRELPRGTTWMDTGTISSLAEASEYIRGIEDRHGYLVSCPEEVAWRSGWIGDADLAALQAYSEANEYGEYLRKLLTRGTS